MERWVIATVGLTVHAGCGSYLGAGPTEPYQVELLEDEKALVIILRTGQAVDVERSWLPAGAREGDVVSGGKVDRVRTEAARRQVRDARRAFSRERRPLTPDRKR